MNKKELNEHVDRLRKQIDDLRYRYHVLNDPQVTDAMYDGLMDELKKIEETHPELLTPDSPTQRVAGVPLEKFEKIPHSVPQWSFNDAFDEQDLRDWEKRIFRFLEKKTGKKPGDISYTCELKIDGLHIVLTYRKGKLMTAATRGDGKVGEDVTQNIKTIQSVPIVLKEPISITVEGEVWLSDGILKTINEKRKRDGEPLFANPRNAAAGTIRQLDAKVVAERRLALTAYDISAGDVPKTQQEELRRLNELGFLTDKHWRVLNTMDGVLLMYKEWKDRQKTQPFWVDGLVVKVNQREYQDALGFTGKAPRWAIALKFPAEQGTTRVKEVYAQVGRTGALTPVALMEPVKLAGTTVTHATLHNFDEIKRLGVRVGDTVVVEKAGDIIPKVVRVLDKMRTGKEKKIHEPRHCPICHASVERRVIADKKQGKSAGLFCTNRRCYAKELQRLIHFAAKRAFDIEGLGKKIVEQLVNEGLIKDPADMFTLTSGDLEPLERFAEKSAVNLIDAIRASRGVSLERFIYALGIPHVGEETARRLAKHFGTLKRIMRATRDEYMAVEDVGPNVADAIVAYMHDKKAMQLIERLLENGVKIKNKKLETGNLKLFGKTFVLTGTLEKLTRDQAKDRIRALGGNIANSVSKKTDYLVVGENPGSKYDRAKELRVRILNEEAFLKMM